MVILKQSESTSVDAGDPRLRSLVVHHPFRAVWQAAISAVTEGSRWSLEAQDARLGTLRADVRHLFGSGADEVEVTVSLDELGRTRVDVSSRSRGSSLVPGRHARRIARLLRRIERELARGA